jgi:hypothetical protein
MERSDQLQPHIKCFDRRYPLPLDFLPLICLILCCWGEKISRWLDSPRVTMIPLSTVPPSSPMSWSPPAPKGGKMTAATPNNSQADEQNQSLFAEYENCDNAVTEARRTLDSTIAKRSDVIRRIVQANKGKKGPYYFNGAPYRAMTKPIRNAANQPTGERIWYFRQYYDPKQVIDLGRHLAPFDLTD